MEYTKYTNYNAFKRFKSSRSLYGEFRRSDNKFIVNIKLGKPTRKPFVTVTCPLLM